MYWIKMTDGNVYFISASHRIAQLKILPRHLIWDDVYIVLLGIVLVVLAKQRAVNVNVMCRLMSLNGLGSCVPIKISLFFLLKGIELQKKGFLSYASCLVFSILQGYDTFYFSIFPYISKLRYHNSSSLTSRCSLSEISLRNSFWNISPS